MLVDVEAEDDGDDVDVVVVVSKMGRLRTNSQKEGTTDSKKKSTFFF